MISRSVPALIADAETGVIEYVTPKLEEVFGYSVNNVLLGQLVEVLIPEDKRDMHKVYRDQIAKSPINQSIGFRCRPLMALHADGSLIPVSVDLHFERSKGDLRLKVTVSIFDQRGLKTASERPSETANAGS